MHDEKENITETPETGIESDTFTPKEAIVELTAEEIRNLDDLGPQNEQVQKWMADNGIQAGDTLITRVDGEDSVRETKAEDFMTRDISASDAWNEAKLTARAMVTIEEEIDEHSAEIGHDTEAILNEEEIRKVGDEGLESAGIEEPYEQMEVDPELETRLKRGYEQQVGAIKDELSNSISLTLNKLGGESESIINGETLIVESTRMIIKQLDENLGINNRPGKFENYSNGTRQTFLKNIVQELQRVSGSAGRYGEQTSFDLKGTLAQLDRAVTSAQVDADRRDQDFIAVATEHGVSTSTEGVETASSVVGAVKGEVGPTKGLSKSLSNLEDVVFTFRKQGLDRASQKIEAVLKSSYATPIGPKEIDILREVTKELQAKLENKYKEGIGTAIQVAHESLQTALSAVRSAHEKVQ